MRNQTELDVLAEKAQSRQQLDVEKAYWAGVEDAARYALGTAPEPKGP